MPIDFFNDHGRSLFHASGAVWLRLRGTTCGLLFKETEGNKSKKLLPTRDFCQLCTALTHAFCILPVVDMNYFPLISLFLGARQLHQTHQSRYVFPRSLIGHVCVVS